MKSLSLALLVSLLPDLAAASTLEEKMKAFVETEVRAKLADPMISAAIKDANAANFSLTPAQIQALDGEWQADVAKSSALVKGVAESTLSSVLRDFVGASGGTITEVILMDAKGLNVAVSDVTSDYWQGDEDKFLRTFAVGPGAIHFSEVEFDESSQSYQLQVSFTITDPASGLGIGAATIGLNAEAF